MAPIAFVTGASRGIGRACAVALAEQGYDVAVAARTLVDGTATLAAHEVTAEHPATMVPGGLDSTVAAIEAHGQRGHAVVMDLLDRTSVLAAADDVLDHFGRIDVLVNNAIYQGPGSMTPLLELADDEIGRLFEGNVHAQLALIRHVLPSMLANAADHPPTIVNMISGTAHLTPPGPIGQGGWGVAYAMTKAALERIAPVLNVEHGDDGLVVHSVDPGFVRTERAAAKQAARGDTAGHSAHFAAANPDVIGAAVAWLVAEPDGRDMAGEIVHAQRIALQHQLVPDWR